MLCFRFPPSRVVRSTPPAIIYLSSGENIHVFIPYNIPTLDPIPFLLISSLHSPSNPLPSASANRSEVQTVRLQSLYFPP